MSECTVLELKDKLGEERITLLDVRQFAEYAGGRVSGARLIPLEQIERCSQEIDRAQTIYVMCRTGRRSAAAQKRLNSLGFENVINVKGGFAEWKAQNLPYEKDENAPWSLERQVRFTAGLLVLSGILLSILVHQYFIGLAVFVGAGLVFAGATDWCGMALLLAKLPWNGEQKNPQRKVSAVN